MTNPPAAVKLALESICLMLGEETNDWKKIRQVIIRDNFISSIVNFSSEDMRYWCQKVYLGFMIFNQRINQMTPVIINLNRFSYRNQKM